MHTVTQYFSTSEVAQLLGVHVSTIKRWTKEGKLECIKTVGGHRKFSFLHIAQFLQDHQEQVDQTNLLPIESEEDLQISYEIMNGNADFLGEYIFTQAIRRNRKQVHKVLNGLALAQYPLYRIYDEILTPVLHRIGDQWEANELTVIEEHIAAQTIRDAIIRLQGILPLPEETHGNVLCLSLTSELHDIAIKMADHILEQRGFTVLFSGQMTPLYGIETILQKYEVSRLYISSTFVPNVNRAQFELDYLYDHCSAHETDVIVGGTGFDTMEYDHPAVKARLYTFKEIQEY